MVCVCTKGIYYIRRSTRSSSSDFMWDFFFPMHVSDTLLQSDFVHSRGHLYHYSIVVLCSHGFRYILQIGKFLLWLSRAVVNQTFTLEVCGRARTLFIDQ